MNLLPFFSIETWILLLLFVALLIVYGTWPFGLFKKLGIPGPRPLPFFGTCLEYRKGFLEFDTECFKKYGKIWGIYDGRQPAVAVMDPQIIKTVLVKECYSTFTNRRHMDLAGVLRNAVSLAEDDQWKRLRTVLSPTFTSGKLKEMFPTMTHFGEMLVKNVQKRVEKNSSVPVKDFFGSYSMDVVTSTSFGVNIDSMNNPKSPFVREMQKLTKFEFFDPVFILSFVCPFLTPLMAKMNISLFPSDAVDFFLRSIDKIKKDRERETHKAPLTYEAIMQLDYLDMAVNETLRLYPLGGRIERNCKKDVEINGVTIPKDTIVFIPPHTLHRNSEYWPNPDEFRPERFSKENKDNIDPYTYLPFGAGPRNCIGMRFALLTLKVAITAILQHFTFQVCKETQIPLKLLSMGLMTPEKPIVLKLVPRTNNAKA